MDFFDNIALNNTNRALEIVRMHSDVRPENPRELSSALKDIMRNMHHTQKEEYLKSLTAIHPDYELFMETIQPNQSPIEDVVHACGCSQGGHANANGSHTVQSYMASGEAQAIMSEYKDKLNRIEQEQSATKMVNDKLFKLVIIGALLAIGYKVLLKK